jgi:dTDP-4-dehydrorhamnose 3,5-epimerase
MAVEPRLQPLGLDGAWQVTLDWHTDERGAVTNLWRDDPAGIIPAGMFAPEHVITSTSRADVIRGVHYTTTGAPAKFFTCVRGGILDVIVDLRVGSPKFGWHLRVRLDEHQPIALLLEPGLGHAWCALGEDATVVYAFSAPYERADDRAVNPLDPALKIVWPMAVPILSDRDRDAPTLEEAKAAGLLPVYSGEAA